MDVTRPAGDLDGQGPHADISRRSALRLSGGALAALLLAAGTRPRQLAAQDATPAAPTGAVGITVQPIGAGQPAAAPGLELTLRRLTIAPGGRLPAHSHPGTVLFVVEAGTSVYRVLGGTAQVTRAAAGGTPTPAEAIPVGTEVILNPGDWVFADGDPRDDSRNDGTDDYVALIAGLTRVGEPFTTFVTDADMAGMEAGATPTP